MFESNSAVGKSTTEAFLKTTLSITMSQDFDYDKSYISQLEGWLDESSEFLKRFKLPVTLFNRIVTSLIGGSDPNVDDKLHGSILNFFKSLQLRTVNLKAELDLTNQDIQLLNALRLYYVKGSENALKTLNKQASRFRDSNISSMFVTEVLDISSDIREMNRLSKKYKGSTNTNLPIDVITKWREKAKKTGSKTADHEKYLKANANINKAFKESLSTIVRSSGHPKMLTSEVIEKLEQTGVPARIPKGFVGYIDDLGNYYTTMGLPLNQVPAGEVLMNPNYNPEEDNAYVCKFKREGSPDFSRAYTKSNSGVNKLDRYATVWEVIPKISTYRKKWREDMRKSGSIGTLATLIEYIDYTASRISSLSAQSHGNKTHGATTFEVKHVHVKPNFVRVSYKGKSEGIQIHDITTSNAQGRRLVSKIKRLIKNKKPNAVVFSVNSKVFTSAQINKYLRQNIGMPSTFTVHMFRKVEACKLAKTILNKSPFKRGGDWKDAQVNKWLKDAMLKVGESLGHNTNGKTTSATAIKEYIDPNLIKSFYDRIGARMDSTIERAVNSALAHK